MFNQQRIKIRSNGYVCFILTLVMLVVFSELVPSRGIAQSKTTLPKTFVMGSNPVGSLYYTQVVAMSKVISDHTGIDVKVFPQGTTVCFPMMETKEVDTAIGSPHDLLAGYLGTDVYEKPTKGKGFNLNTLLLGGSAEVSLIVAGDSNIKTLKDLRGKKVVTRYGAFFGIEATAKAGLANAGLTTDDVIVVPVTGVVEGVRAVIEGRAIAAVVAVGSAIVEELKMARGARILPFDPSPEAWKRTQKMFPGCYPKLINPGTPGVDVPTITLGYGVTISCRGDLHEEVAYEIVKVLWVNAEELGKYHATLKSWTQDAFKEGLKDAVNRAVVPYHAGAIKWYREIGLWTKALEEHQGSLLKLKK